MIGLPPVCLHLVPLIGATVRWLLRAYPPEGGALGAALAEAQARQATTVAAWLRYPTEVDAALAAMVGPGGSARLDWLAGADGPRSLGGADGPRSLGGADGPRSLGGADGPRGDDGAWRTWVDEVVASWAACLLTDGALAQAAATAVRLTEHAALRPEFRRLTAPDPHDLRAAALSRHPDLLAPVANLHRADLVQRVLAGTVGAA